jgi:RimJ/RimL family protein N-acetyltransferase
VSLIKDKCSDENNIAMQKLAKYFGMGRKGVRRKAVYKTGRYLDIIEYGVLRSEYVAWFNLSEPAE